MNDCDHRSPAYQTPSKVLRERLATRGAGVVEDPAHLVDEGLGLRLVGADAAVNGSLVRQG